MILNVNAASIIMNPTSPNDPLNPPADPPAARAAGPSTIANQNIMIAPAYSIKSTIAIPKSMCRFLRSDSSFNEKKKREMEEKQLKKLMNRENITVAAAPRRSDTERLRRDSDCASAEYAGSEGFAASAEFQVEIVSAVSGCFELLRAFSIRSCMVNRGGKAW